MNRTVLSIIFTVILIVPSGCGKRIQDKDDPILNDPLTMEKTPDMEDGRPVIVAFGNSLTEGAGIGPGQNYPSKLQKRLDKAGREYRVINEGISGETSAQGLNRTDSIVALNPEIVIVEFGANDGLRGIPIEITRRNLQGIVDILQAAGIKVVLAGMQMPPNYGPQYTNSFRELFTGISKESGIPLIPFFLDGVGGHPGLNQEDGIHPTAEGYDIVVENVWKVLEPLLR